MFQRVCGCLNDSLPERARILETIHQRQDQLRQAGRTSAQPSSPIQIGVVYHICYQSAVTADSSRDIADSIDKLNRDFATTCSNFDCGAGVYQGPLDQIYQQYVQTAQDVQIEFYLVKAKYRRMAPVYTNNISVIDNTVKRLSPPISPNKYLNIWVPTMNNGLLGYAQFPWNDAPQTDGVLIARSTFGRRPTARDYNLGKTLTHEIGHWLGLYHTFQETHQYQGGNLDYAEGENPDEMRGDCVVDTPTQLAPTFGSPLEDASWPTSRVNGKTNYHMYMNFMDYTNDNNMFLFTRDQAEKIHLLLRVYRPEIAANELEGTREPPAEDDPSPMPRVILPVTSSPIILPEILQLLQGSPVPKAGLPARQ